MLINYAMLPGKRNNAQLMCGTSQKGLKTAFRNDCGYDRHIEELTGATWALAIGCTVSRGVRNCKIVMLNIENGVVEAIVKGRSPADCRLLICRRGASILLTNYISLHMGRIKGLCQE